MENNILHCCNPSIGQFAFFTKLVFLELRSVASLQSLNRAIRLFHSFIYSRRTQRSMVAIPQSGNSPFSLSHILEAINASVGCNPSIGQFAFFTLRRSTVHAHLHQLQSLNRAIRLFHERRRELMNFIIEELQSLNRAIRLFHLILYRPRHRDAAVAIPQSGNSPFSPRRLIPIALRCFGCNPSIGQFAFFTECDTVTPEPATTLQSLNRAIRLFHSRTTILSIFL